jgi:kynurenine formamidase
MMKLIDLSVTHGYTVSEPYPPKIEHSNHSQGAQRLAKLAGIEPSDFPDTMALASDNISGASHSGTHMDAPAHYGPLSEGKPAKTIDEVPLEWCYGPAVVLDMRHKEAGAEITVDDLKAALAKINYTLKPMDIVLIWTGCDKYWGTDKYMDMQSGLGIKGTSWLLDQGVKCVGIDAWTVDRPVKKMVEEFKKSGDNSELWPSHMYGRKKEYLQIEKLANLDQLPKPFGFKLVAFPIKFEKGTAAWTRAVAIIEGEC